MTSRSLSGLVAALLLETPGTAAAEAPQHAIESLLMAALRSGGRQAGEELVESLVAPDYELERLDALPCMWRVAMPPPRVLEIWFTGGDHPIVAAVSYRIGKPWGSRTQRIAAKRQAAFYEWYGRLNPLADALSPDDRLIQLVGELAADVNNGGFGQYVVNKSEARAHETLTCLAAIGARRTARWLAAALAAAGDDVDNLDHQFNEKGEDLASLVMIYLGRRM